ncbi:hypothetical protein HAX54_020714, partial [Datura stramonium]|nr:hypothetical protein [Datura stramonium]
SIIDGDGGASSSRPLGPLERIETEMAAMWELLGGFPRPPFGSRPSSATAAGLE